MVEAVALEDRVLALVLVDPAEADEAGDRLVDPLARRADHAGQLLLGDREDELVGALGQLEQALGGAAGDVEEHAVGQRLVGDAQALGQQAGDAPQQRGSSRNASITGSYGMASTVDGSSARAIAERGPSSSIAISPNRSPGSISATTVSRWSIGLAMAMAMRPRSDEVQRVGDVALVEQHVTADEVLLVSRQRRSMRALGCGASAKNSVWARRSS